MSVTASAAAQGTAVGLLVSLLFALVPLLEIRQVKPLLLLRADTAPRHRAARLAELAGRGVAISSALALVAMWQADSVRAGLFVSGGLAVAAGSCYVASRLLVRLTQPLTRSRVSPSATRSISLAGRATRRASS